MKCDQRVKVVFFHAGSALNTLWAASQRGYLTNSRADDENNGKVAFLANSESMGMINLDPRHSRETDRVTVTNYCVTLMMKCNTWHVDYLYDTMVIAIALDVCWDVVMDMKSKNGLRGLVYLMISWEPILVRENMQHLSVGYILNQHYICQWFLCLV